MSGIRLMSPETAAKLNADIEAFAAAFKDEFRRFNLWIWHENAARAAQRRRDLDDELDWLGDWGGRRG